jgi:hypothetical protein
MTAVILSEDEWGFDEIESKRVAKLETAGSPEELIEALRVTLVQEFHGDGVRFGHERNSSKLNDWRSILQIRVGTCLFDWFFNARTGYRAHFKKSPETGLKFNDAIVQMTVSTINAKASQTLDITLIDVNYKIIGTSKIPCEQFLLSFVPTLSKIWLCALLIEPKQIKQLPLGATGPKIRVSFPDNYWLAFYQESDADAWLELKGAFCGTCGLYQPKDPICRAKTIHQKGTA